ncbi:IS110 family transposase [Pelagibius sp.]|uniref:IS110 family transposase n=1 Tax=Pelagibius sp. TaxID=1931238 RepID=UPI003BAFBF38
MQGGQSVGERSVSHGGAGLAEACDWLTARTAAAPGSIAVAIEVPHGPVVEALLERGFQVYAINPKQLDRFRDRFSVAGAKDDRRDAHVLAERLKLVKRQVKSAHRHLETLCDRLAAEESEPGQGAGQRDVTILRSMPGTGRIVIATLLAEAWQPLCRRDYHALRTLAGVAPVTLRSGKRCLVARRYACNRRLANALYHWARVASQRDVVSRRRYGELRRRGHSHGRALRTIGDRLLAVACTLLQRRTRFDPDYAAMSAAAA